MFTYPEFKWTVMFLNRETPLTTTIISLPKWSVWHFLEGLWRVLFVFLLYLLMLSSRQLILFLVLNAEPKISSTCLLSPSILKGFLSFLIPIPVDIQMVRSCPWPFCLYLFRLFFLFSPVANFILLTFVFSGNSEQYLIWATASDSPSRPTKWPRCFSEATLFCFLELSFCTLYQKKNSFPSSAK